MESMVFMAAAMSQTLLTLSMLLILIGVLTRKPETPKQETRQEERVSRSNPAPRLARERRRREMIIQAERSRMQRPRR